MKRRLLMLESLLLVLMLLCSCSGFPHSSDSSTFSIQFIDVGQGDSALVECDGRYMLIDGGDVSHGDKVYSVLVEKGIQHLDILAISHYHQDHIGGLDKALTYASAIDKTIACSLPEDNYNSDSDSNDNLTIRKLEERLVNNGAKITVPHIDDTFMLGSAEVKVIDVAAIDHNDSLVLMISYGKNRFLFTGDIEDKAQTRITNKYMNDKDEPYKIDVIKMPHHGAYTGTLYNFLRTFMADNVVISVGANNGYGHPKQETLNLLTNPKSDYRPEIYRTDVDGDIFVRSDGEEVKIETNDKW